MTKLNPICAKMPFFSLFSFLLLHLFNSAHSQTQLYDQEHAVLLKLKQYLENPSFLSHWTPSNLTQCSWPEITCRNGSVTGLALVNTNITQPFPPFICDLQNLTRIDFQLNFLPGEFPTSLYKCSVLEYLDLSQNNFVGKIPDDIDRLSNLRFLNLGANNFSGDIPASIGRLKELTNLQLFQCQFNGTIPVEIGNLFNLEFLFLAINSELPPTNLPVSFTQLQNLKNLLMYDTNLIGEIPETIGEMVALEYVDLSGNQLTGEIPSGFFTLKNLTVLFLHNNRLSGTLQMPAVVEALNLTILDVSENNLTGNIPEDLGSLQKLTGFGLQMNQLSGEVPESLARLPALIDFIVFSNNLSGPLPLELGLHSSLRKFEVASNSFTGPLPVNLCFHGKLEGLTAFDNKLSGELPESLGNCPSLGVLEIYNNEFSGSIPSGLWTSLNLTRFRINENKFTGELPQRLSSNLSFLSISHNQFSGRIPAGVSSWTNVVVFNASKNLFNGSIPQELTALPRLTTLLLDQNHFEGPLPSEIISWKSLTTLNLSRNQLSGQIPDEIGRLPVLSVLDLSQNQFSGQIPSELDSRRITSLNLSSNQLTGRIPSEFENLAYDTSFLDNSGLCADSPVLNITLCNSGIQKSTKRSSVSLALIISLAVVGSLAAFLSLLLVIRVHRKRKQGFGSSTWKLTSFQKLGFTESNILSELTDRNIIGSGGYGTVYRVAINQKGDFVAVKKTMSSRKLENKLENAFLAEVRTLSSIRHNNIVKLLCCISGESSKLLVYEYLENRSLDQWLHRKRGTSAMSGSVQHAVLDWPKRLQIAIGAAQGLSYMHHDCLPPIIHRDIKSSNILLDSEFNVKIADFGLARMLMNPGELATMSAVTGSFGYIAPEYAQTTRVNEKIDVYSFGVVLLELTTGKEANYGDEYSSLAEWAWRHVQVGNSAEDVLDEEIKEPSYVEEMCCVFKLGVMCTTTLPSSRPSMKEVVQILLRCSSPLLYGEKNLRDYYDVVPLLKNSKREDRSDVDNDS
ncbi:hypothetical protein L6164_005208 [Bauhinia variegata]|uniref:Uncharacterized protein n=1 Tax=Bauhinia variegata TaxID=167791 RepID=A0ACB9PSP7_BAUVA|nr:hypothetical protein L6164_005208 [Bauhinia variegata]